MTKAEPRDRIGQSAVVWLGKIIASAGGIGFIGRGGGTFAAIAYCTIWILVPEFPPVWQFSVLMVVLIAGTWSAAAVEKAWGEDSARVVIDEVAGMMIALLFVPVKIEYMVTALLLFRFFDIVKPMGIRYMEKLPSGWGVMADDVLSGIYTLIIMHTLITIKLF